MEWAWYEVWCEEGEPLVVLIVRAKADGSSFEVFNPQNGAVSFATTSYDEVRQELSEDEYVLVTGRMDL